MGWQADIFERLRDRDWHHLGALFEEFEKQIPLHHAMRSAMQESRGRTELPDIGTARWELFRLVLSSIGVETDGEPHRRRWNDQVRLRYVADRQCEKCGRPVIKATWTTKRDVVCLYCNPPVWAAAAQGSRREPAIIEHPRRSADQVSLPVAADTNLETPHATTRRGRRNFARAIKEQFWILGLSLNEIERQLQRMTPDQIILRYRQSLQARPRPPPANSWRSRIRRAAVWLWTFWRGDPPQEPVQPSLAAPVRHRHRRHHHHRNIADRERRQWRTQRQRRSTAHR